MERRIVITALLISIISLAIAIKPVTDEATVLDVCLMVNPEMLSLYGVELCGMMIPETDDIPTSNVISGIPDPEDSI